jgi:ParB family transcriptional regulator, chromosome partitioning protein
MRDNALITRPEVQWVPINSVIPNPLNPRKNDAIKTEEMQEIILNKGWEIPLTVYKKGAIFVVLSGHRRLYAAKQTRSIKEIPVYIVEQPENHQEEVERIASLQRGQVDWSPYEWAKFTYERWLAWGKPGMKEFSKKITIPERTVSDYIQVFQYFPRHEIEDGLETKRFSMSTLSTFVEFMRKLKSKKSVLVESMTEELIRQTMLAKMEKKLASRDALRRSSAELLEQVSDDDFVEFLTTSNMGLQDLLDKYAIPLKPAKTLHGRLVSIGIATKSIKDTDIPYTQGEQERLLKALEDIQNTVKKKITEIKKVMP